MIFENRKLEIKENYNSYDEITLDLRSQISDFRVQARWDNSDIRNIPNIRTFLKFLAKRIRAHDGCLGIRRL